MELRHLRYFATVAETENITKAAELLRVSQPSLSRQIRDLEDELGLTFFIRSAKSLRLTPEGRLFATEARAVLERVAQAESLARSLASGEQGEIHVGYAPSLTARILPQALRIHRESSPGVQVHLHDLSTTEMLDQLRLDRLQVALMIRPSERTTSGIIFEVLRSEPVRVAMAPGHPFASHKRIGLAEISEEKIAAYSRTEYPEYHIWFQNLFKSRKTIPRITEEHDASTSLIASVESGRAIALVQKGFESLAGSRLVLRPITPAPPSFDVGIAFRQDQENIMVRRFIQSVYQAVVKPK